MVSPMKYLTKCAIKSFKGDAEEIVLLHNYDDGDFKVKLTFELSEITCHTQKYCRYVCTT